MRHAGYVPMADTLRHDEDDDETFATGPALGRVEVALALEAYQARRCSLVEAVHLAGTSVTGFLAAARAHGALPTLEGRSDGDGVVDAVA